MKPRIALLTIIYFIRLHDLQIAHLKKYLNMH